VTDFEDASVNENGQPLGNAPESPMPSQTTHGPDGLPAEAPAPEVAAPEPALFGWGAPAVPEPPVEPASAPPTPPVEPSPGFDTPVVEPSPAFDTPVVIPEPSFEFVPEPAVVEPDVAPAPVIPEPLAADVQPAAEVLFAQVAPASEAVPETAEPAGLDAAVPVVAAAGVAEAAPTGFSDGLTGELQALTEELEPPLGEAVPSAAETAEMPAVGSDSLDDIAPGTVATDGDQAADAPAAEGAAVAAVGEGAEGAAAAEGAEAAAATEGEAAEGTAAAAVAGDDEAALEEVVGPRTKVSWWPFVGYIVVWLGAAGYAVWQLQQLPAGQAAYETNFYTMSMLGGLALLAVGPVLLLIVWLASWIGRENRRIGLMFISALLKGALATLIGAMIWIGALMLVDYLRLGRPF